MSTTTTAAEGTRKLKIIGFNHFKENMRLMKLFVAAELAGLEYEFEPCVMKPAYAYCDEAYLRDAHPLGRTPVIVTPEGDHIFESNTCLRWMARNAKVEGSEVAAGLYGKTAADAFRVDSWLDFALSELESHATMMIHWKGFNRVPSDDRVTLAINAMHTALEGLNNRLENKTFLVADCLTIADINMGFCLDWAFRYSPEDTVKEFAAKYPNVIQHYNRIVRHPISVEVLKQHECSVGVGLLDGEATN